MVKTVTHERQEVFELFKGLASYTFDCMYKGARVTCICMSGKFWSSEPFMPQFLPSLR